MKQEVYQYDKSLDKEAKYTFIDVDSEENKRKIFDAVEGIARKLDFRVEVNVEDFNDSVQHQVAGLTIYQPFRVTKMLVVVEPGNPIEQQIENQIRSKIKVSK